MEFFQFTAEEIFKSVKTESSLFASRQFKDNGDPLYRNFVFDEEYSEVIPLFRELFFSAQANIISIFPNSLLQDCECSYIEEDAPDDFIFCLKIKHCHAGRYNGAYNKVITIKTKEALVSYIMYRWLETKSPSYSEIYHSRYKGLLDDIRKNVRRVSIGSIRPFPW